MKREMSKDSLPYSREMMEHTSLLASLPRDLEEMERTMDPNFLGSRHDTHRLIKL
jgi:hypothetical protein